MCRAWFFHCPIFFLPLMFNQFFGPFLVFNRRLEWSFSLVSPLRLHVSLPLRIGRKNTNESNVYYLCSDRWIFFRYENRAPFPWPTPPQPICFLTMNQYYCMSVRVLPQFFCLSVRLSTKCHASAFDSPTPAQKLRKSNLIWKRSNEKEIKTKCLEFFPCIITVPWYAKTKQKKNRTTNYVEPRKKKRNAKKNLDSFSSLPLFLVQVAIEKDHTHTHKHKAHSAFSPYSTKTYCSLFHTTAPNNVHLSYRLQTCVRRHRKKKEEKQTNQDRFIQLRNSFITSTRH